MKNSNMKKRCSRCKEWKDVSEFGKDKSSKDGLYRRCRPCVNAYSKEKKSRLVIDPATGETVTAGALAKRKLVIDPNTGETVTATALSNRKHRASGAYAEYCRNRRTSDPLFKLAQNIRSLVVNSMRGKGFTKATKTAQLLGCSFEEFEKHLGSKPTDGAHLDHRLPCSCATDPIELIALQHYSNLRYLPATENLSKGGSLPQNHEELKQALLDLLWEREGSGEINLDEYFVANRHELASTTST